MVVIRYDKPQFILSTEPEKNQEKFKIWRYKNDPGGSNEDNN